jgi:hypothetical protein
MELDLIAEAMVLAIELSGQERLVAADRPVTAAWLRTGFVLVQPETKALRIAWSNDFGN